MNPWDSTRKHADIYEMWRYEANNGMTLKSWAEFLSDELDRRELVRNTPEGWNS